MSLGSNTFLKSDSHYLVAAQIFGVRNYVIQFKSKTELMEKIRAQLGNVASVVVAQASVDQFGAAVRTGAQLLSAARAQLASEGMPSRLFRGAAPSDIPVEDWNLAYFVDEAALADVMPLLDQTAREADQLVDIAMKEAKPGYTGSPTGLQRPIDWNPDASVQIPQVVKDIAANTKAAVEKTAKTIGMVLLVVGVLVVAGIYFANRRKTSRG